MKHKNTYSENKRELMEIATEKVEIKNSEYLEGKFEGNSQKGKQINKERKTRNNNQKLEVNSQTYECSNDFKGKTVEKIVNEIF